MSSVMRTLAGCALAAVLIGGSVSPAFASDERAEDAAAEEMERHLAYLRPFYEQAWDRR